MTVPEQPTAGDRSAPQSAPTWGVRRTDDGDASAVPISADRLGASSPDDRTDRPMAPDLIGADSVSFELVGAQRPVGVATLQLVSAETYRLSWVLEPGVSPRALPSPLRLVLRAAFGQLGARRVESHVLVSTGTPSSADATVAMRAGLRKEGVARGYVVVDGEQRDVIIFASVAGDPAPEHPEGFTAMLDSVLPMKRLIAHVVIRDQAGRILLCETTFKKDWELPGGIVEPGEAPMTAAQREVTEEIGVDLRIGRLLVLDWLPPHLGWSDAIELLYDGGQHDSAFIGELVLDQKEIQAVRWCELDEAVRLVSPLNARRLPLLVPSLPADTLHLVNGLPV